jgi:hypothetical protein
LDLDGRPQRDEPGHLVITSLGRAMQLANGESGRLQPAFSAGLLRHPSDLSKGEEAMRHNRLLFVPLLLGASAMVMPAVAQGHERRPAPFDDARLEIELNATDGDAGIQVFADSDAEWKRFEIFRPDGRKILDIDAKGVLRNFGLSELFSESSEPPFTELPFAQFEKLFPAGNYRFEGTTVDGHKLASTVPFSHKILKAPQFVSPIDGGTLPAAHAVIRWKPVHGAVDYEVIVTSTKDESRVLDTTVSPSVTRITVPPQFLDRGTEYKIEVHASHASGNRIFTEIGFTAR